MQGRMFHSLEIVLPEARYDVVAALLSQEAPFGWEEAETPGGVELIIRCENGDFLQKLAEEIYRIAPEAAFTYGSFEQKDWLENWKQYFTPVQCGERFLVLPPWLAEQPAGERKKVIIDPKSAFGTGHHASTVLCLTALSQLLGQGRLVAGERFLDLGCGSGILGIAAVLCGMHGVGLDIDSLAVENARENAQLNDAGALQLEEGSVEKVAGQRFDLIMANILAAPLRTMAPAVSMLLRTSGWIILSGILQTQADDVEAAYVACGLRPAFRLAEGEWAALVLQGA